MCEIDNCWFNEIPDEVLVQWADEALAHEEYRKYMESDMEFINQMLSNENYV